MSPEYGTFAHLAAEKVELYRAVLDVFRDAKTRFVLHPAALRGRGGRIRIAANG